MRLMVSVIGTDGSGKTTVSDLLASRLTARGTHAERVWLGAESVLMAPVRALLRHAWRPRRRVGGSSSAVASAGAGGYDEEIHRKNGLAHRHPRAAKIYVRLAWLDYRFQVRAKLRKSRDVEILVADRYLFDVAVNIGLALGWGPDEVVNFSRRKLSGMLLPQVRAFIRVEPEVSLSRKDDIPDIHYLQMRLRYYDAIAAAFGFRVFDGTRSPQLTADELTEMSLSQLGRPYVHYVHANNKDVGGADRVLALMAAHSRDPEAPESAGCRVAVSLREPTAAVGLHSQAGVPVFLGNFVRPNVSAGASGLLKTLVQLPGSALHFRRLFRREQPDIVHVNDLYDFVPAAMARRAGIPVVYHIRMIKGHGALRRGFAKLIPAVADASVSVSRAVREHYFGTRPDPRHRVIHDHGNAVLVDQWQVERGTRPSPLPDGGRLTVMVGRIEPWKGQHVYLEAVRLLPKELRERHVFALVGGAVPGRDDYYRKVEGEAASLGVLMLGERADVPALLRAADISVHASTEPDPFPGVVIESLLAGAATVAARAGGVPEMVTHEDDGLLTNPGDPQELAVALKQLLLMDEVKLRGLGERGRTHALRLVDSSYVDEQLADLYRSLCPSPRSSLTPRAQ